MKFYIDGLFYRGLGIGRFYEAIKRFEEFHISKVGERIIDLYEKLLKRK